MAGRVGSNSITTLAPALTPTRIHALPQLRRERFLLRIPGPDRPACVDAFHALHGITVDASARCQGSYYPWQFQLAVLHPQTPSRFLALRRRLPATTDCDDVGGMDGFLCEGSLRVPLARVCRLSALPFAPLSRRCRLPDCLAVWVGLLSLALHRLYGGEG